MFQIFTTPCIDPARLSKFLLLLAIVLVTAAASASAQASEAAISTGRDGGSYDGIGRRLQAKMRAEHGFPIAVQQSSGSIQNLARLADPTSSVALALTQADALAQFLQMNAEFAREYIVLGDAGKECVVLIGSKRSGIRSFAELVATPGAAISVEDPGSGAAVTFRYLLGMNPGLGMPRIVHTEIMETLLQLKVGGAYTDLRAAMVVQRPSTQSEAVKVVLTNPDDYLLVPIPGAELKSGSLPDDSAVHTFERVRVGSEGASGGIEVETVCTRSLLLASKRKLDRSLRSKLSRLMLTSGAEIIGKRD
jgi:hypothetical protein